MLTMKANAQESAVLTRGSVPLLNVFEPDSLHRYPSGIFTIAKAMPAPGMYDPAVKECANALREQLKNNPYPPVSSGNKRAATLPQIASGFSGAHISGTPNDNNMAINNDSMRIS